MISTQNFQYPMSEIEAQPIDTIYEKVKQIDLGPIAYKLMNPDDGEGWSEAEVREILPLYQIYLALSGAYPNQPIVPTKSIDEFWHTHIMDTAKYRHDCKILFGGFLDHFPYLGLRGEEDEKALEQAFQETRDLFKKHFGVDPKNASADCATGTCSPSCSNKCGCSNETSGVMSRPTISLN